MGFKVEDNTEEALRRLEDAVKVGLEAIGMQAQKYASNKAPVDTGNLARSITHMPDGDDTMVIGTNVEYAPYVELGTVKMKAQPYLAPAVEDHVAEYERMMKQYLQNA